jgi:hypothetical protein
MITVVFGSPSLDVQAFADDSRVREIDRQVRESWSELAAICIRVRDKLLWKYLINPYTSFDDWLMDAAPVCRSTIYRGMGILSVIAADVRPEDIAGIEIGNASLLAQLSSGVRQDPEIIAAAKSGRESKKLRQAVRQRYPDQLVELIVEKKLRFTESQWGAIEPKYEAYQLINPNAGLEEFFEFCVSEAEDAS